jgi:hypothetical protein
MMEATPRPWAADGYPEVDAIRASHAALVAAAEALLACRWVSGVLSSEVEDLRAALDAARNLEG